MALPSCLVISAGGRHSQRPGPSPTLGSLGPSHRRRHKSQVSLPGPLCAHGVSDTPHGEVCDMPELLSYISTSIVLLKLKFYNDKKHIMRKIIVVYIWHPWEGHCFRVYKVQCVWHAFVAYPILCYNITRQMCIHQLDVVTEPWNRYLYACVKYLIVDQWAARCRHPLLGYILIISFKFACIQYLVSHVN